MARRKSYKRNSYRNRSRNSYSKRKTYKHRKRFW